MCKVFVYKDRGNTWRARVVDVETRKIVRSHVYRTEQEARDDVPRLERAHRRPVGVMICKALDAYREHLATRGNRPNHPNRPRTIEVTLSRLGKLFKPVEKAVTGELTPKKVQQLWDKRAEGMAVDTNLNTLSQTKTFIAWLARKGWLKMTNLLEGIEVRGSRRRGKPQLTEDESRRFFACALEQARAGDRGAVAAACALLLGMRASEIADRTVRNLDAGGTKLLITEAKTQAGIRVLKIPARLQPLLRRLTRGRQPADRIFGEKADRFWVRYQVRRLCRLAGVPVVPPHGLRGTHVRLAVEVGTTPEAVARALGHENFDVTEKHYAGKDAVDGARIDRVEDALTEMDEEEADDDQDADATVPPKPAADEESAASPQGLSAAPPDEKKP